MNPGSPTTCGLQNSESPPSNNLNSQETINEGPGTFNADYDVSLSYPGSSVVAETAQASELNPLIKSPAPIQPENTQDIQDEELPSVSEDEG